MSAVIDVWNHLSHISGARRFDKANAAEMELIATQLDNMGVLDKQKFLKDFSTTIGKSAYFPFELEFLLDRWSSTNKICIIAHEIQHVFQLEHDGALFTWNYMADGDYRARQETEASTTSMEVYYYLTGKLRDPVQVAEHLKYYACSERQIEVVVKGLNISRDIIAAGGITTRAGKLTVAYLQSYTGAIC